MLVSPVLEVVAALVVAILIELLRTAAVDINEVAALVV